METGTASELSPVCPTPCCTAVALPELSPDRRSSSLAAGAAFWELSSVCLSLAGEPRGPAARLGVQFESYSCLEQDEGVRMTT